MAFRRRARRRSHRRLAGLSTRRPGKDKDGLSAIEESSDEPTPSPDALRAAPRFAAFCLAALTPALGHADQVGSVTKLPLPRFASLKTDRVNLREGPSKDHATKWVYQRAGLPVEITAEFEIWRRIRNSEGADGWVLHSLLSGRRTALVTPNRKGENSKIYVASLRGIGPRRDAAVGRDRQSPQMRRRLVSGRRRRLQGLYRAIQALGRLPQREDRMTPDQAAGCKAS